MNIEDRVEKIEFQIRILAENYDLGQLYVYLDLDNKKLYKMEKIFEKYDDLCRKGLGFTNDEFETEILEILNGVVNYNLKYNYQTIKMIIKIYDEQGKFKDVCKSYLCNK